MKPHKVSLKKNLRNIVQNLVGHCA